MVTKKHQLFIIFGSLVLLFLALSGIGGLAQQAGEHVYLPLIYRHKGGIRPTQTASTTPTATSTSTSTSTPTGTATSTATPTPTITTDCALLRMSDFEIRQYNRPALKITNHSANEITITQFGLEWISADFWAWYLDYPDVHVDWFKWNGVRFYLGDDYDHPTIVDTSLTIAPGATRDWEIDFDWIGEQDWAFMDEFGLTDANFGFWVEFGDDCSLYRPEIVSLPPTLTPSSTPTASATPTLPIGSVIPPPITPSPVQAETLIKSLTKNSP